MAASLLPFRSQAIEGSLPLSASLTRSPSETYLSCSPKWDFLERKNRAEEVQKAATSPIPFCSLMVPHRILSSHFVTGDGHKQKISDSGNEKAQVGAIYVQGMNDGTMPTPTSDENLPVATPIDAECVAVAPPIKYDDSKPAAATSVRAEPADLMLSQNDARFGRHPCMLSACPHCGLESRTKVRTHPNLITWALSIILLFLFWPICWIPLVVDKVSKSVWGAMFWLWKAFQMLYSHSTAFLIL